MSQSNIRVAIRSRPLVEAQKEKWAPGIEVRGNRIILGGTKIFDPDLVLDPEISQSAVFEECIPIIECVKLGRNGTIMVYGQTGTGKTHTMLGGIENSGIAFGAISHLLEYVRGKVLNGEAAALSLSMIEIYNERMTDMLDSEQKEVLLINGTPRGNTKVVLSTVEHAAETVRKALSRRHVSPTMMNDRSSRSHVIVVLDYEERSSADDHVENARLYLVDLAGSECVKKSQAIGKVAAEAGMINRSLLALRNVVLALTTAPSNGKAHVPYRDSKLTELLQDSIGGTARTMLIACISPVARDIEETKSTLEYATRARKVKNNASDEREKLMMRVRSLEWQLQAQVNKNGGIVNVSKEDYAEMNTLQCRLDEAHEQIDALVSINKNMEGMYRIEKYERSESVRAVQAADEERNRCAMTLHDQLERLQRVKLAVGQKFNELARSVASLHSQRESVIDAECQAMEREILEGGVGGCGQAASSSSSSSSTWNEDQNQPKSDLTRMTDRIQKSIDHLVADIVGRMTSLEESLLSAQEAHAARVDSECDALAASVAQHIAEVRRSNRSHHTDVRSMVSQQTSHVTSLQHMPSVVSTEMFESWGANLKLSTIREANRRLVATTRVAAHHDNACESESVIGDQCLPTLVERAALETARDMQCWYNEAISSAQSIPDRAVQAILTRRSSSSSGGPLSSPVMPQGCEMGGGRISSQPSSQQGVGGGGGVLATRGSNLVGSGGVAANGTPRKRLRGSEDVSAAAATGGSSSNGFCGPRRPTPSFMLPLSSSSSQQRGDTNNNGPRN